MKNENLIKDVNKLIVDFKTDKKVRLIISDFVKMFDRWFSECAFIEIVLIQKKDNYKYLKAFNAICDIMISVEEEVYNDLETYKDKNLTNNNK